MTGNWPAKSDQMRAGVGYIPHAKKAGTYGQGGRRGRFGPMFPTPAMP